jgi:carbamoyltransferase
VSVILGINAFHAGSSAALVIDGTPVAAIAEERLNRVKHFANFPKLAIARCLQMAGLRFRDIDAVAVGRDSSANRGAKIDYTLRNPSKLLNLLKIKAARQDMDDLRALVARECDVDPPELRFASHHIEHHLAHIASAYFVSEWEHAAGFSMDGSGDFVTTMLAECHGPDIRIKRRVYVPHSLGSFYSMLCEFLGYDEYGDEGKVMGLAPYGTDRFVEQVEAMVGMHDGEFTLNPKYFATFGENQGITIDAKGQMILARHYTDEVVRLLGAPRQPDSEILQRDQDVAFAMQRVFEKVYFHMLQALGSLVPETRIAMAGGCVLNSVANGKLFEHTGFRETCIQPAAGDEGLSLGAALHVSNAILREGRRWVMENPYLGPEFCENEVREALESAGVPYTRLESGRLIAETADEIAAGNVIGWFQGRMEWGPRALGNRSILAHPGLPDMKDLLNARIKRREWFRPFAPNGKPTSSSTRTPRRSCCTFTRSSPSGASACARSITSITPGGCRA